MVLPRMSTPRGSTRRRVALWSALAMGTILPSVGCQVEYAGMTLPSGRYMHDDVQYFPSGPDFPWANSQAASQRARMRAMGVEPAGPVGGVPPGYIDTDAGSVARWRAHRQPEHPAGRLAAGRTYATLAPWRGNARSARARSPRPRPRRRSRGGGPAAPGRRSGPTRKQSSVIPADRSPSLPG